MQHMFMFHHQDAGKLKNALNVAKFKHMGKTITRLHLQRN